jgi:hypothetical protein
MCGCGGPQQNPERASRAPARWSEAAPSGNIRLVKRDQKPQAGRVALRLQRELNAA